MKILTTLTYYRPHYSGLTIYAERLARTLAGRGHTLTVLTSRYDRALPADEMIDGVRVVRPAVLMHVSKGVLMPAMPWLAWRLARQADVVHLHLPQLDAAYIALIARLLGKPVVLTYHCDLLLPSGFIHRLANLVSNLANRVTASAASLIVTNTRDFAEHSPFLRRYLDKVQAIPPPVEVAAVTDADIQAFRQKVNLQPGQRVIGMAARLAAEKGVEYLVQAMPEVLKRYPTARVLYQGQYQNVMGEEAYARKLTPMIDALGEHWTFLGNISAVEMAAFFKECEVTVLPSINSTESFGMVQVESMTCGTPVVASDMPGVRQPVRMTGMGRIVPLHDAHALAQALIEILDAPADYRSGGPAAMRRFSSPVIAEEYEQLFNQVLHARQKAAAAQPAEKGQS